jgi:hypothetical protein
MPSTNPGLAQTTPRSAPPEDDLSANVQQLAALHSQGLLTDDEFAAAEAKALGI